VERGISGLGVQRCRATTQAEDETSDVEGRGLPLRDRRGVRGDAGVRGEFLETAGVYGKKYGTPSDVGCRSSSSAGGW
jgi:hypothetical protein